MNAGDKALSVLHCTGDITRAAGGVSAYLWSMANAHAAMGLRVGVAGFCEPTEHGNIEPHADAISLTTANTKFLLALGHSPALARKLSPLIADADLVHLHGIRRLLNWGVRRLVRKHNTPLVVSTHGQLLPPVLRRNRLRKAILNTAFVQANLRSATCFHATTPTEAKSIRDFGLTAPIAVVPIGITPDRYAIDRGSARQATDSRFPVSQGKKRLVFLGLLTRGKGLLRLAEAWSKLTAHFPDWQLVIAGPDAGMEATARNHFEKTLPGNDVLWAGPVYDQAKYELLAGSDLLVLPSDSENFGIVVIEALAAGTPVITTTGAPWSHLPDRGCGWSVAPTSQDIHAAIEAAVQLDDSERVAMGQRGQALVHECYDQANCAQQMRDLYQAVARGGDWPDFVLTD